MSDQDIWNLKQSDDYRRFTPPTRAAVDHKGQPTVILAQDHRLRAGASISKDCNAIHQMEKLTLEDLKEFRDTQRIPFSD